jgi:hypothetical protein
MSSFNVNKQIVYIGANNSSSTSRHRADALRRIGCSVVVFDPYLVAKSSIKLINVFNYHTSFIFLQNFLLQKLKKFFSTLSFVPDVIWINSGELISITILKWLKCNFNSRVILYQNDDPTSNRDGNRFLTLRKSIPYYDLCVCVRYETELDFRCLGAKNTYRVMMSFDECAHKIDKLNEDIIVPRVGFLGTLIKKESRDIFILDLLRLFVPVDIIGPNWTKSKHWLRLKKHVLKNYMTGSEYSLCLQKYALSLGFLSHGNRDLITTRTFEIPAAHGLLCAEKTSEHQLLYEHLFEAVFWSSPAECASLCKILIQDMDLNKSIRINSFTHLITLGQGNEDVCLRILRVLFDPC